MAAFQASQVAVGTTAAELVSGLEGRYQIVVSNYTDTTVYLGSSGVTTGDGFALQPEYGSTNGSSLTSVTLDVLLDSTDALYAIAGYSGQGNVGVMVNPR